MTDTHLTQPVELPQEVLQIADRLESVQSPLICSHVRLDGDAIGSALGLAHTLTAMGRHPRVVNDGAVPKVFGFLPGVESVRNVNKPELLDGELVVVLDSPAWSRTGSIAKSVPPDTFRMSIDHHLHVEKVGDLEWNDTSKSAVGEMIYEMIVGRGWPLTPEAATCLYVAVVTDTGRFTFGNTTSDSLRASASLIQAGADHRLVSNALYESQEFGLLQLRCEAGRGITLHFGGEVACMRLTRAMFAEHGVVPIDTQEFADIPRSIAGVEVGVTLREMDEPGRVKASLRSCGKVDVAEIARTFDGGGHVEAAGCDLKGSIQDAEAAILSALKERMG